MNLNDIVMLGDRLLVTPKDPVSPTGLVVTEVRSAGVAVVEKAAEGCFIKPGALIVYDRMSSTPLNLEMQDGSVKEFFIVKTCDVGAYFQSE